MLLMQVKLYQGLNYRVRCNVDLSIKIADRFVNIAVLTSGTSAPY